MISQNELMEISDVRQVMAELIKEEHVPQAIVYAAQETVSGMCRDASEFGITNAEVVKAVLRPVFSKRRGCECSSCKSRRSESHMSWRVIGVSLGT